MTELDYYNDLVTKEKAKRQLTSYKFAKKNALPVGNISTFISVTTGLLKSYI